MPRSFRLSCLALIGLAILGVPQDSSASGPRLVIAPQTAGNVKKTTTLTGQIVGYEVGDYVHAIVRTAKGKETAYFIAGGPELNCFLAAHMHQPLRLKIQTLDTYLEEAGGRVEVTQISDAALGNLTTMAWWNEQLKLTTAKRLMEDADATVQRNTGRRGSPTPILYAVNGWVFGVQIGKKWAEASPKLAGDSRTFQTFRRDRPGKSVKAELEWAEEGPVSALVLKTASADPDLVQVSDSAAKLVPISRITPGNPTYAKFARDYAKSIGKSGLPALITDGFRADLNGDGQLDVVLAVSSVLDEAKKTKIDYAVVIVRTLVGGKVKTFELVRETGFGLQHGPFRSSILAVGDFDGDKTPEFLLKTADPWGETLRVVQLNKSGKPKILHSAGIGE